MSFAEIKGQDSPLQRLKKYLSTGHLPGAFLFTGPEAVGKSLAALVFAKAVNCEQEREDSCDSCVSCLKIDKDQHPDVHLIDAHRGIHQESKSDKTEYSGSEIKIEYIRQLQAEINLKPYEGRKKVFIINNAHALTAEASNAFLKTLEEPPRDSIIILISSKPMLLFKTILSRCQVIKFSSLKREELKMILKKDYALSEPIVHFLSYFCEGRIGQALRLKETDIITKKNSIINSFIFRSGHPGAQATKLTRDAFREYLFVLATWFRDVYMLKAGLPYNEIINLDRREELVRLKDKYTFPELEERFKVISNSLLYLERNINVKLLLSHLKSTIRN